MNYILQCIITAIGLNPSPAAAFQLSCLVIGSLMCFSWKCKCFECKSLKKPVKSLWHHFIHIVPIFSALLQSNSRALWYLQLNGVEWAGFKPQLKQCFPHSVGNFTGFKLFFPLVLTVSGFAKSFLGFHLQLTRVAPFKQTTELN